MVRLGTILGCGAALLLAGCDAGKPQPTATEPAALAGLRRVDRRDAKPVVPAGKGAGGHIHRLKNN